jgi:hypothetical protein
MNNLEPRRGAFAFCSRNELGLILSETPIEVIYRQSEWCAMVARLGTQGTHAVPCECEKGFAWTGIHLSPEKFGQPWSSRTPRVVGEIRTAPHEVQPYFVVDGRNESRAHLHL